MAVSQSVKIHAALSGAVLIYGINFNIAKDIMPEPLDPFAIIILRIAGAWVLFFATQKLWRLPEVKGWRDYLELAGLSIVGASCNQLCFFEGLAYTSPINASVIMMMTPMLVTVLSSFITDDKLTRNKIIGLVIGGIGAFFLMGGMAFSFKSEQAYGDFLILINAILYGLYLVLVRRLTLKYGPVTTTVWVFFFGMFVVVPVGFEGFRLADWSSLTYYHWGVVFFVVFFMTYIAYLLNAWAMQFVQSSVIGVYLYVQPVISTLIAYLIGKGDLTVEKSIYALLIFLGVFIATRKPKQLPATKPANA